MTDAEKIERLGQLPVGRSKLMLYARPSQRTIRLMKERGVTMIVTAQSRFESVKDIEKICTKHGLKHFWIELCYANEDDLTKKATLKYLRKKVKELMVILQDNEEVALIHCAAGLHRTGTLGYAILRLASPETLSREEAYLALKTLREDTWKHVGDWRIDVAERHLVKPILEDR